MRSESFRCEACSRKIVAMTFNKYLPYNQKSGVKFNTAFLR